MLAVKTIIERVRSLSHDVQETGYTDNEIVSCINAGIRFINRIIKDSRPELLMAFPATGILPAGECSISINKQMAAIIDVRANGHSLNATTPFCIKNLRKTAPEPTEYYLVGFSAVALYPTPTKDTEYAVFYVEDTREIGIDEKSPLPNDYDDCLIEYALIRLSMGNEFDMSQEMSVMQTITAQVERLIANYPNPVHTVHSYYDLDGDDCQNSTADYSDDSSGNEWW